MRRTGQFVKILLSIALLLVGSGADAQQGDTKDILRQFVQTLNMAGRTPLNLQMDIRYSANLVTQPDDTLSLQGEFYLRSDQAYIRMGEQEQLMNDSVALLISDNLQRMILYQQASSMISRIRSLPGLQWSDSSVKSLASQFKVMQPASDIISLQSKLLLPGTKQARTTYELQYEPALNKPRQLIMTQHVLVGMDSAQYALMQQEPAYVPNLFTKSGQYFFIKEKKLTVTYKRIEQPADNALPVILSDRIEWTVDRQPKPVGKYLAYELVNAE
jgi:hypothetical protein